MNWIPAYQTIRVLALPHDHYAGAVYDPVALSAQQLLCAGQRFGWRQFYRLSDRSQFFVHPRQSLSAQAMGADSVAGQTEQMPTKHGLVLGRSWRSYATELNLATKRGS